jgi:hypothetical protein
LTLFRQLAKENLKHNFFFNHKNALKIIRVIALNDVINFCIGEQVCESDEVLDELGVVGRFEEHPKLFGRERRQDRVAAGGAVREEGRRWKELKK